MTRAELELCERVERFLRGAGPITLADLAWLGEALRSRLPDDLSHVFSEQQLGAGLATELEDAARICELIAACSGRVLA